MLTIPERIEKALQNTQDFASVSQNDDSSSMISANVRIKETCWLTAVDLRVVIVNHDFSLGNDIFN